MHKRLSPAIFGLALICFFLPWFNVSCQGQKVATFSGIQVVTGTTVDEPQMFGSAEKRKIEGETLAIFAFLSALAGLALSFIKTKKGTIGTMVAGGIGTVFLLLLKSKLDNDVLREGQGMLQLDYGVGFYMTLLLFLSAAGVNVYSIMQDKKVYLPQGKSREAAFNFCTQCGARVDSNALFCSECGHSLK